MGTTLRERLSAIATDEDAYVLLQTEPVDLGLYNGVMGHVSRSGRNNNALLPIIEACFHARVASPNVPPRNVPSFTPLTLAFRKDWPGLAAVVLAHGGTNGDLYELAHATFWMHNLALAQALLAALHASATELLGAVVNDNDPLALDKVRACRTLGADPTDPHVVELLNDEDDTQEESARREDLRRLIARANEIRQRPRAAASARALRSAGLTRDVMRQIMEGTLPLPPTLQ